MKDHKYISMEFIIRVPLPAAWILYPHPLLSYRVAEFSSPIRIKPKIMLEYPAIPTTCKL